MRGKRKNAPGLDYPAQEEKEEHVKQKPPETHAQG